MFTLILSLLKPYLTKILVGLAVLVAVVGLYFSWKKAIEAQATLKYNQKQLEQIQKDQQDFLKKMQEIADIQNNLVEDLKKSNAVVEKKTADIITYLNSDAAKKSNRPASELLKQTIRDLQ
jgi:uncharacterized protein YoxC